MVRSEYTAMTVHRNLKHKIFVDVKCYFRIVYHCTINITDGSGGGWGEEGGEAVAARRSRHFVCVGVRRSELFTKESPRAIIPARTLKLAGTASRSV